MSACACILLDYGTPCGLPSEVEFVMGCVHEHLEVDAFCGRHQQLAVGGDLLCVPCDALGIRMTSHVLSAEVPDVRRVRAAAGGDR